MFHDEFNSNSWIIHESTCQSAPLVLEISNTLNNVLATIHTIKDIINNNIIAFPMSCWNYSIWGLNSEFEIREHCKGDEKFDMILCPTWILEGMAKNYHLVYEGWKSRHDFVPNLNFGGYGQKLSLSPDTLEVKAVSSSVQEYRCS